MFYLVRSLPGKAQRAISLLVLRVVTLQEAFHSFESQPANTRAAVSVRRHLDEK